MDDIVVIQPPSIPIRPCLVSWSDVLDFYGLGNTTGPGRVV